MPYMTEQWIPVSMHALRLEQGETVSQSFTSKEDKLDGINIKMSVSGQADEKKDQSMH